MFRSTFQRLFVYNILFEDSEVDEALLDLDERSRVLSITGAGCGVAAMIARRREAIDAVDINPHHLALAALKSRPRVGCPATAPSTTCSVEAGIPTPDPCSRARRRRSRTGSADMGRTASDSFTGTSTARG
ncbi:MAG: hypothetical protein OHK0013_35810 [Sandaracinaceae bacterium]